MGQTYAAAGVNISAQDEAIRLFKDACRATYRPEVVTDVGSFGGMWALDTSRYRQPLLVSSMDGIGTKVKVAGLLDCYDGLGLDLVHHCVNDIAVMGAEPLFFLDYFATGKLAPGVAATIVTSLAGACRGVGCALIGGELAEMPGLYQPGDFDVAGCIVGLVERDEAVDGRQVVPGDVILGLPSSGLHTNGYSLARKLVADGQVDWRDELPELGTTVGAALLEPHRCYLSELRALRGAGLLKAAAHITGGGFQDNLPRVLPDGVGAVLERGRWSEPPIFGLLARLGRVADDEMLHTFNMGLGMLVVVAADRVEQARTLTAAAGFEAVPVGHIETGAGVTVRAAGQ